MPLNKQWAETPKGWMQQRLGECADQRTEKTLPEAADTRRYVALEHLAQGRPTILGWFPAGRAVSAKTVFHKGDVLFGKLRPNLRKAARAPFDGLCSTDILPIFGKGNLETPYLLQLAQSDDLCQHAIATASGTKMPRTSWKQLSKFVIKLPSVPEQRKIAAILSSVDDAIEKTQAVIEQVQVVKQGLMEELLTRGLPGRHTRFKQTAIGEEPEEWRMITLADMAEPNSGIQTGPFGSQLHASDYVAHGVPVIMPKDLVDGYVSDARSARISDERANDLHRHRVRAGDMLFARRGDVGRVGLITKHQDGWVCGTGCFRFRPIDPNISSFLRHWIGYSASLEWLKEHAVGQTMLNLNTSILSRLPVALPSEEERSAINDVLEALARQIETHKRAEKGLVELKQALMLLLLTGKLRVTLDTQAA